MGPQIATPKIHQQKREVVEHIDARDVLVELHGVEQRGSAVDETDVAQVQVAVALADPSDVPPGVEAPGMPISAAWDAAVRRPQGGGIENTRTLLGKAPRVAVDHPCHAFAAATIRPRRRAGVQAGDRVGKALHQPGIQPMALGETVEEGVLVEPHHLDDPVDRLALPSQRERASGFARDRPHAEIESGCRPAVHTHLGLAGDAPELDRRKIHVVEAHGPLELLGPIAGQPDDADVGVDAFDRRG